MIIRVHIIYNSFDRVYPLFSVHSIYPTYLSYMSILSWSAPGLPSPPLVPAFGRGPGIAHVALPRPAADLVGTGRTDATQQLQNRVVARLVSLAFFGWGIKRGSHGKNGVFFHVFSVFDETKKVVSPVETWLKLEEFVRSPWFKIWFNLSKNLVESYEHGSFAQDLGGLIKFGCRFMVLCGVFSIQDCGASPKRLWINMIWQCSIHRTLWEFGLRVWGKLTGWLVDGMLGDTVQTRPTQMEILPGNDGISEHPTRVSIVLY